ncbi:hypothetical protein PCIT_a3792 [Pseudoalteromonas citrea]|uniref:Uncharacterized protein n=3 Tax=Pseudoalteromonas citrea TaxID=43655 RepID=A0AAD4AGI5_9GAMM|nr:hypothetical protein PCIT_a3792 [Pseudoalteromonas citrea]
MCCCSWVCWGALHWETIQTEHFNVHYTKGHQAWAQAAAQELETVRDIVLVQQNRSLPSVADVVVFDPYHGANGFALPSTDNPLMALFTTPPQSDTVISNHHSWLQLLILHEYVHLVHLSQPTRHRFRQVIRDISDIYDLTSAMVPRWVAEGYATLLESKITGRGRLFDNYSEAIIREFARQGALPTYAQLNGGDNRYLSDSMAYLLGARFLAWLESRYSEHRLDAVWTRMQAVKKRDFEDAFQGIFNHSAAVLYRRFTAAYTYHTMQVTAEQPPLNDALWTTTKFSVHSPALSPDKGLLAVVERDAQGRSYLNVYSTSDNAEAKKKFIAQQKKLLEIDPHDIADTTPEVYPKKLLFSLPARGQRGCRYPHWQGSDTLLFVSSVRDKSHATVVSGELFSWSLSTGKVTQLTENARIRRFTLNQRAQTMYAEQVHFGYSQLVEITLATNHVKAITHRELGTVYDHPVLNHSGNKLAYLRVKANGNWQLVVRDLVDSSETLVPMPKGYQYLAHPQWDMAGRSISFVAGRAGLLDIYRYDFELQTRYKLTDGQHVFTYPLPLSKDRLLFLAKTAQGTQLRVLSVGNEQLVNTISRSSSMPLASPRDVLLPKVERHNTPLPSQPYDIWRQSTSLAVGGQYHSNGSSLLHVGITGSDLLDLLSWQVGVTQDLAGDALSGRFADLRYVGQYANWHAKVFDTRFSAPIRSQHYDKSSHRRRGIFLQAGTGYQAEHWRLDTHLAGQLGDELTDVERDELRWSRFGVSHQWHEDRQSVAVGSHVSWHWLQGKSGEQSWQGYDLSARLFGRVDTFPWYISGKYQHRHNVFMVLGGLESPIADNNSHVNTLFIPELSMASLSGLQYQQFGGGVTWRANRPWLYYHQHHLDRQLIGHSYGLRLSRKIEKGSWLGKFAPAGVSNLRIDMGLSRLSGASISDENSVWLGIWYDLR